MYNEVWNLHHVTNEIRKKTAMNLKDFLVKIFQQTFRFKSVKKIYI